MGREDTHAYPGNCGVSGVGGKDARIQRWQELKNEEPLGSGERLEPGQEWEPSSVTPCNLPHPRVRYEIVREDVFRAELKEYVCFQAKVGENVSTILTVSALTS